jgi:hypothetical protein
MTTTSRALIAIVPSFMVAVVMLWVAGTQGARATGAMQANDLAAAAAFEVSVSVYVVGAVLLMCLGPALWLVATRPESA